MGSMMAIWVRRQRHGFDDGECHNPATEREHSGLNDKNAEEEGGDEDENGGGR